MGIADHRIDYVSAGFDVGDTGPDPIEQWHVWYEHAVASGTEEPNAMALATVDADGRPDCRYVLVRRVDHRGFAFYTNLESTKGRELAAMPYAAGAFRWYMVHRQVRLRGPVELV